MPTTYIEVMKTTANALMKMADDIDGWARQSREGGWSTHQVDANRKAAAELREKAANLYRHATA